MRMLLARLPGSLLNIPSERQSHAHFNIDSTHEYNKLTVQFGLKESSQNIALLASQLEQASTTCANLSLHSHLTLETYASSTLVNRTVRLF